MPLQFIPEILAFARCTGRDYFINAGWYGS